MFLRGVQRGQIPQVMDLRCGKIAAIPPPRLALWVPLSAVCPPHQAAWPVQTLVPLQAPVWQRTLHPGPSSTLCPGKGDRRGGWAASPLLLVCPL